jgi:hypothetical protein
MVMTGGAEVEDDEVRWRSEPGVGCHTRAWTAENGNICE